MMRSTEFLQYDGRPAAAAVRQRMLRRAPARTAVLYLALAAAAVFGMAAAGSLQEAHAQPSQLEITPVGNLADTSDRLLDGASDADIFQLRDSTRYAAVASSVDDGLQIVNITDPASPSPAGNLSDASDLLLDHARSVDIFAQGQHKTFAAVAGDRGLQIVDITDPASPFAVGSLADDGSRLLFGSYDVETFVLNGRNYAAVASAVNNGLQIVDITDTSAPNATGQLADTSDLLLANARGVTVFTAQGGTFAAVTSIGDDGLQLINITNPNNLTAAGQLEDISGPGLLLDGARGVAHFTVGLNIYVAVTASTERGLQIVNVTDPYNPAAAGKLQSGGSVKLHGATGVDTFRANGGVYALVASNIDDAIQIVDVSDPYRPAAVGSLQDAGSLELEGASAVAAFQAGGSIYALAASSDDDAIQILELTDTPPMFVSAALDESTGEMTITFDDTLDISDTDLSLMYLSEAGDINAVPLTGAVFDDTAPDSPTISLTLDQTQLDEASLMVTPQLDIRAGAVENHARSTIDAAPDNPINRLPGAPAANITTAEDTPVTITPAISDSDAADTPRISAVDDPPHGTAVHNDTAITYTPDQDYNGTDAFGYTVTDGTDSVRGIVTVNVTRDNNAPVLGTIGNRTAEEGLELTVTPTLTDDDPTDEHSFNLTRGTLPAAAVFNATDGTLVWTPSHGDVNSTHTVTITVDDGRGGADSETFDITVVSRLDKPEFASAALDEETGIMTITFDEAVNVTAADLSKMYVSDAGETNEVALAGAAFDDAAPDSDTISMTLSQAQLNLIIPMTEPQLDIAAGAVSDLNGNTIDAAADNPIAVAADAVRPAFAQASFDDDSGILKITFDEAIDVSEADLSRIYASDAGGTDEVPLAGAAFDGTAPDSDTISMTLTSAQLDNVIQMGAPQLDIAAGAVSDISGNAIEAAPDNPIDAVDNTKPRFVSAAFDEDTGIMTITFHETIDVSETRLRNLHVSDAEGTRETALNGASLDRSAADSDTISLKLTAAQLAAVIPMGMPQLGIEDGAVRDPAGNVADTASNLHIAVTKIKDPIEAVPVGQLADTHALLLNGIHAVDIFTIGNNTYAAVAAFSDNGIQVVNVTDPSSPEATAWNVTDNGGRVLQEPTDVKVFVGRNNSTYAAVTSGGEDSLSFASLESNGILRYQSPIIDTPDLLLDGAASVDIFALGDKIYAAVASFDDDGLQILDVTRQDIRPRVAGNLTDVGSRLLDGASDVDIFTIGNNTYAAVASAEDDGLQIANVTDPHNPAAAGSLRSGGLRGAVAVDIFTIDASTYAAVACMDYNGLQIANVTDPYNIAAAGSLRDAGSRLLDGARDVSVFAIGDKTYAAVASYNDDGIQFADVTDPAAPRAAGSLADTGSLLLDGAWAVDIFEIGGKTYAAAAGTEDNGLQIALLSATDNTKPEFVSAALDRNTGIMTIAFDEIIDVSAVNTGLLYVSDAIPASQIPLAGAGFDSTAPDSDAISLTLDRSQLSQIGSMTAPQLDIGAGAVFDLAGNAIDATTDKHITFLLTLEPAGSLGDDGTGLLDGAGDVEGLCDRRPHLCRSSLWRRGQRRHPDNRYHRSCQPGSCRTPE